MFAILYSIGLLLYGGLMRLAALFHPKAKQWHEGRKDWYAAAQLAQQAVAGRRVVWFHTASLGEFEQGRPIIEAWRATRPGDFILLTFFSPSGYEVRKHYPLADYVAYLPLDTASNARRFVALWQPEVAFFVKYEFWWHYCHALHKQGTKLLAVSAIFRPNQFLFSTLGREYRKVLHCFSHFFVQNETSVRLLAQIGLTNCTLTGDTRFDRVAQLAETAPERPEIEQFVQGNPCLVIGSAWEADMQRLLPVLNDPAFQQLKVILAPHEIHQATLARWEAAYAGKSLRYTAYQRTGFALPPDCQLLMIDNVGMLSSLYRYGQVAYIGGAYGQGLHNILEAATFGLPIIFGNKNYTKFQEAVDLIGLGAARSVGDAQALHQQLHEWLTETDVRQKVGAKSRRYVQQQSGATAKIMAYLAQ